MTSCFAQSRRIDAKLFGCRLPGIRTSHYWTDFSIRQLSALTGCQIWSWIPIAPVENGCLNYVPGSHRWQLLPRTELAGAMDGLEVMLTDEQMAVEFFWSGCNRVVGR